MAVQQNKKSPSKRGMHRAHDFLPSRRSRWSRSAARSHLRHHISPSGYYRGKKVVKTEGRRVKTRASRVRHHHERNATRADRRGTRARRLASSLAGASTPGAIGRHDHHRRRHDGWRLRAAGHGRRGARAFSSETPDAE